MNLDFSYKKQSIQYTSGIFLKGPSYRCHIIKYRTLYEKPIRGSETVEVYTFVPKGKVIGSSLILHGLGTRNIKFFLWMGSHLASAGITTSILILPGNYTRVEHDSVSGKNYLWPDIKVMFKVWENAIVDIQSTLDLLDKLNYWSDNNCSIGYCLGGMLLSIVSTFEKRLNDKILITTGCSFPEIFYNSNATRFIRKMVDEGYEADFNLHDKAYLIKTYKEQLSLVKSLDLKGIVKSQEIHPLFKIDPLSYAHLLDKSKFTFIDALFDEILSFKSRALMYREMRGATRYTLPITHTGWLPFERFLAQYVMIKLNISDKKLIKKALKKTETFVLPWDKN